MTGGKHAARDREAAGIVTVAVPCRFDEPSLHVVFDQILAQCRQAPLAEVPSIELLFCINGIPPGDDCLPLQALREGCAAEDIPLSEEQVAPGGTPVPVARRPSRFARALLTPTAGKAHAWNLLRHACSGNPAIVCDADVTFSAGAFARLHAGLLGAPELVLFSPKTDCRHDGSVLERILAVPYRLDFPNLSGQLYAMRPDRVPVCMPEDLLEPERWLELEVGPQRVGRDPTSRVYVRLTATLADFFRQRVRIEMGKVQLHAAYPHLMHRSRPQPDIAAVRALPFGERAALAAYLTLRAAAHARAWWLYRSGRRAEVWVQPRTTKQWPTTAGLNDGAPVRPAQREVVSNGAADVERTGVGGGQRPR
jgi:hypothetical protein